MSDDEKPNSRNKLTNVQWAEVAAKWETGDFTLKKLGLEYGITEARVSKKMKDIGAAKGQARSRNVEILRESLNELGKEELQGLKKDIKEAKDFHFKSAKMIGSEIMLKLVAAKNDKKPYALYFDEIKTLKEAANALSLVRAEKWAIMGVENIESEEDRMPELGIRDLTEEEIVNLQNAGEDEDDFGIIPEFDSGVVIES